MPFEITSSGPDIPDGTYPATLESVEELTGGKFGNYRKWHWLVEVDGKVVPLGTFTSANTGTGTVSYSYLTSLLGKAPKIGERVEDPTGNKVLLQIVRNDKGYPTIADKGVLPIVEPEQIVAGIPR